VLLAWLNDHAVWLRKQNVAEEKGFFPAAGHCKKFRMGGNADYPA